jgi:hypothetical protein
MAALAGEFASVKAERRGVVPRLRGATRFVWDGSWSSASEFADWYRSC